MKLIYDSEKPAHERVVVEGEPMIIGCFDIRIEFTMPNGKAHSELHMSRWGTAKERAGKHKAVREAADSIQQQLQVDSPAGPTT